MDLVEYSLGCHSDENVKMPSPVSTTTQPLTPTSRAPYSQVESNRKRKRWIAHKVLLSSSTSSPSFYQPYTLGYRNDSLFSTSSKGKGSVSQARPTKVTSQFTAISSKCNQNKNNPVRRRTHGCFTSRYTPRLDPDPNVKSSQSGKFEARVEQSLSCVNNDVLEVNKLLHLLEKVLERTIKACQQNKGSRNEPKCYLSYSVTATTGSLPRAPGAW